VVVCEPRTARVARRRSHCVPAWIFLLPSSAQGGPTAVGRLRTAAKSVAQLTLAPKLAFLTAQSSVLATARAPPSHDKAELATDGSQYGCFTLVISKLLRALPPIVDPVRSLTAPIALNACGRTYWTGCELLTDGSVPIRENRARHAPPWRQP